MATTTSQNLKEWFDDKLTLDQKKEVLRFLYGKLYTERRLDEGMYYGPAPEMIKEGGLFSGPAPAAMQTDKRCPTCGRPY